MSENTTLDPRISEFQTQEQADSYDLWFRAKVQEAIDSKKPRPDPARFACPPGVPLM